MAAEVTERQSPALRSRARTGLAPAPSALVGLTRDLLQTYRARRERPLPEARVGVLRDLVQLFISAALAAAAFALFRGLGDCVGLVMAAGTLPFGETFAQAGLVCVSQRGQLGSTVLSALLLLASGWTLMAD